MRRVVLLALNISLLILGNRGRFWGILWWFLNNIKEYQKKTALTVPQTTLNLTTDVTGGTNALLHLDPLDSDKVDGGTNNLPTEVTGETNVGLHMGPLDSDKADGCEDDFVDMSPFGGCIRS